MGDDQARSRSDQLVPEVRYAGSPGDSVAYQRWGDGGVEMVLMTNWRTSVDNIWEHPGRVRFLTVQGTLAKVTRFDPRGLGASDPIPIDQIGDRSLWAEDALRVMDENGIERAVFTAEAFATQVAISLAVDHPERVERLVLLNPYARLERGPDFPVGHDRSVLDSAVELVAEHWGTGRFTEALMPTLATGSADPGFLGRTERLSATRAAARAMIEVDLRSDVRDLLNAVKLPTLVLHTGDFALVPVEISQHVADHIAGAHFVRAASRTFYWGDGGYDEYASFVCGHGYEQVDREVVSILFTDIVGSTESMHALSDRRWRQLLDGLDTFVAIESERSGGRVVKQTGDGHLVVFPDPIAAVSTAVRIVRGSSTFEIALRVGVHAGEVQRRRDGDVAGIAVHVAQRIAGRAEPPEVLVSRTVVDLLGGSGFRFDARGEHELKGVPGRWQLLAVADP